MQDDRVDDDPDQNEAAEQRDEGPAAAEIGDLVGQPLAERELLLELGFNVFGQGLVARQALDHRALERRQLALLVLEQ